MGVVYAHWFGAQRCCDVTHEILKPKESCAVTTDLWDTVIALTSEDVRDPN